MSTLQNLDSGLRRNDGIHIATWNVNSVKSRLIHLLDWLKTDKPDIVLLQEIKCEEHAFPCMEIEELGYNLAIAGQKSYNGVAILSKFPLSDIHKGLPGDEADTQARYIEAVCDLSTIGHSQKAIVQKEAALPPMAHSPLPSVLRVASVYVPNGQTATSEKFPYKLRFLERFKAHVEQLLSYDEMLVIGGDYNIAPEDRDVHAPEEWHGSVLTHDEARKRLRSIFHLGVYDGYRVANPDKNEYSWWDYRANAFASDDGLRIDHLLLSPQAADKLNGCIIEKKLRALDKASDHTPVIAEFTA